MSRWSDPKWILEELRKKWDSGRILESMMNQDDLFPFVISLKKPTRSDIGGSFAEVSAWIRMLWDNSKQKTGFGYELKEKEIVHSQSGRNSMPTHAIIPTVNDALLLLKRNRDADKFIELAQTIQAEWPELREWISKHPLKVLRFSGDWTGILEVLRWFCKHPDSGLYMRQLDIGGVDTKFIESRKGILAELLVRVLPEEAIDQSAASFEKRFGLREKPARVRFRLLDHRLHLHGFSDITVPVEQMSAFRLGVSRVFITENEVNGLCFPDASASMVIFGLGYGVDILKTVGWLREKEIFYWGDIDTHGFVMLDQVRSFLPQTKSILMGEEILLQTRGIWSVEGRPFSGCLSRLTADEHHLFRSLQDGTYGEKVRLEQERISFNRVKNEIARLVVVD